jgi:hypothetical protein
MPPNSLTHNGHELLYQFRACFVKGFRQFFGGFPEKVSGGRDVSAVRSAFNEKTDLYMLPAKAS